MPAVAADPGDPPLEAGFANAESIEWQVEEFPVQPANPTNFYTEVHKALTTDAPFPVTLEEARAVVEITERARQGTGY